MLNFNKQNLNTSFVKIQAIILQIRCFFEVFFEKNTNRI